MPEPDISGGMPLHSKGVLGTRIQTVIDRFEATVTKLNALYEKALRQGGSGNGTRVSAQQFSDGTGFGGQISNTFTGFGTGYSATSGKQPLQGFMHTVQNSFGTTTSQKFAVGAGLGIGLAANYGAANLGTQGIISGYGQTQSIQGLQGTQARQLAFGSRGSNVNILGQSPLDLAQGQATVNSIGRYQPGSARFLTAQQGAAGMGIANPGMSYQQDAGFMAMLTNPQNDLRLQQMGVWKTMVQPGGGTNSLAAFQSSLMKRLTNQTSMSATEFQNKIGGMNTMGYQGLQETFGQATPQLVASLSLQNRLEQGMNAAGKTGANPELNDAQVSTLLQQAQEGQAGAQKTLGEYGDPTTISQFMQKAQNIQTQAQSELAPAYAEGVSQATAALGEFYKAIDRIVSDPVLNQLVGGTAGATGTLKQMGNPLAAAPAAAAAIGLVKQKKQPPQQSPGGSGPRPVGMNPMSPAPGPVPAHGPQPHEDPNDLYNPGSGVLHLSQGSCILAYAQKQIGKPYSGANCTGPNSYDCSGLIYAAAQSCGMNISGSACAPWDIFAYFANQSGAQMIKSAGSCQAGDIIFFGNTGAGQQNVSGGGWSGAVGHVGVVSSPGQYTSAFGSASCQICTMAFSSPFAVAVRLSGSSSSNSGSKNAGGSRATQTSESSSAGGTGGAPSSTSEAANIEGALGGGVGGVGSLITPSATSSTGSSAAATGSNTGSGNYPNKSGADIPQNAQAIANFLGGKGLNKIAVAGILGNIMQESGGNWNIGGGGLIQITGASPTSLQDSLNQTWSYILAQPGGGASQINAAATSPTAAATEFCNVYERPGIPALQNRINSAIACYNAGYARGGTTKRAGRFLVGERGPEQVSLPKRSHDKVGRSPELVVQLPELISGNTDTIAEAKRTAVMQAAKMPAQRAFEAPAANSIADMGGININLDADFNIDGGANGIFNAQQSAREFIIELKKCLEGENVYAGT